MTLYETLEVTQSATADEIKISYRRLAKVHHPDKGGDEELFKSINNAYSILSDVNKRRDYDNKITPKGNPFTNQNPFSGFGGNPFEGNFRGFNRNFNTPTEVNIYITLEESYKGTSRVVEFMGNNYNIDIAPGTQANHTIGMTGKGLNGADLHIVIRVRHDENVKVVNILDLEIVVDIDLFEYIAGTKKKIALWNEHIGYIKINTESVPDIKKSIRIKGKGLRNDKYKVSGDIYVRLNVTTPDLKSLPDYLKESISKYVSDKYPITLGEENGN